MPKPIQVLQKLSVILEIYTKMYKEGDISRQEYDHLVRPVEDILVENGVNIQDEEEES